MDFSESVCVCVCVKLAILADVTEETMWCAALLHVTEEDFQQNQKNHNGFIVFGLYSAQTVLFRSFCLSSSSFSSVVCEDMSFQSAI